MSRWYVLSHQVPAALRPLEHRADIFSFRREELGGGHKQLHQTVAARLKEGSRRYTQETTTPSVVL